MRVWTALLAVTLPASFCALASRISSSPVTSTNTPAPVTTTPASPGRITFPASHEVQIALPNGKHRRIDSLLKVDGTLPYGSFAWQDKASAAPTWVLVDLKRQILSVFQDGDEIGSAVILYGMNGKPTPEGAFPILEKAVHHRSSLYEAEMPYMLRLTGDGVAIHAANVRAAAATHGCVGVPPAFAKLLFARIQVGDPVYIVQQTRMARTT